jgi:hypothetical protein
MWISAFRPVISGKTIVDKPVDKNASYPHYPQASSYPQVFEKVIHRFEKLSTFYPQSYPHKMLITFALFMTMYKENQLHNYPQFYPHNYPPFWATYPQFLRSYPQKNHF